MDIEQVRKLLSAEYKGQHTLHGFLKNESALGVSLEEPLSIYLFPGTLQLDDSVVCYSAKTNTFHSFVLADLSLTKPVKAHLDKQSDAEHYCEKALNLAEKYQEYLNSIENKYLQSALINLLAAMSARRTLTPEHYNAAMFLLRRLHHIAPSPLLAQLENLVTGYFRLCELNDARKARKTLAITYVKSLKSVTKWDGPEVVSVQEKMFSLLKEEQVSIKEVLRLGKAKIVLQVLFLIEVLGEKHYVLFDELIEGFKNYRADLSTYFDNETLKNKVLKGIEKLVDDRFVEQHDILNAYTLTSHGRALALQLVEMDSHAHTSFL